MIWPCYSFVVPSWATEGWGLGLTLICVLTTWHTVGIQYILSSSKCFYFIKQVTLLKCAMKPLGPKTWACSHWCEWWLHHPLCGRRGVEVSTFSSFSKAWLIFSGSLRKHWSLSFNSDPPGRGTRIYNVTHPQCRVHAWQFDSIISGACFRLFLSA